MHREKMNESPPNGSISPFSSCFGLNSARRARQSPPFLLAVIGVLLISTAPGPSAAEGTVEPRWWKGNLHTHSLWSDGDDYPEMIADWYKSQGYHFLALSDHNTLSQGQKWIEATEKLGGGAALAKYLRRFGGDWVEQRPGPTNPLVRLKPLSEFRPLLEEPGRFLMIQSEELTDRHLTAPIHLNVTHIRDFIPAQGGSNVVEVMQRNIDAAFNQRKLTGQLMFPHVNHPNFGYAITAEELMQVRGEQFFEVYNGHPTVHNRGDRTHADMEKVWDIILARRLTELNLGVLFGLAVDDSHHYHVQAVGKSNSGRGWVVVRSRFLTPEHLIQALEAGDFYASSGVVLKDVQRSGKRLSLVIDPEPGIEYRTEFIGTRKRFDPSHEPIRNAAGEMLRVTHRYSPEGGVVLAESKSQQPVYTLEGNEIYVRARVTSSKRKANPSEEGEFESAWTQPLVTFP